MKKCYNDYTNISEDDMSFYFKEKPKPRDYTGFCFLNTNIPNIKKKNKAHLIVIISKPTNNKSMTVVICSVKLYKGFKYDKSYLLNIGDIRDKNNNDVISKISYVRYDSSMELDVSKIHQMEKDGVLKYKCQISQELLNEIIVGAVYSQELESHFNKYLISSLKDIDVVKIKKQIALKRARVLKCLRQNVLKLLKELKEKKYNSPKYLNMKKFQNHR